MDNPIFIDYLNADLRKDPELLRDIYRRFIKEFASPNSTDDAKLILALNYFASFMKCDSSSEASKMRFEILGDEQASENVELHDTITAAFLYAFGYDIVICPNDCKIFAFAKADDIHVDEISGNPNLPSFSREDMRCCECDQAALRKALKEIIEAQETYWELEQQYGGFFSHLEKALGSFRRRIIFGDETNPSKIRIEETLEFSPFYEAYSNEEMRFNPNSALSDFSDLAIERFERKK